MSNPRYDIILNNQNPEQNASEQVVFFLGVALAIGMLVLRVVILMSFGMHWMLALVGSIYAQLSCSLVQFIVVPAHPLYKWAESLYGEMPAKTFWVTLHNAMIHNVIIIPVALWVAQLSGGGMLDPAKLAVIVSEDYIAKMNASLEIMFTLIVSAGGLYLPGLMTIKVPDTVILRHAIMAYTARRLKNLMEAEEKNLEQNQAARDYILALLPQARSFDEGLALVGAYKSLGASEAADKELGEARRMLDSYGRGSGSTQTGLVRRDR